MKLRILHCPNVVGGNPPALSRAQRNLGAETWCVTMSDNPFGYPVDEDLLAGRGRLRREFARWKMVMRALRDYEVIHYNFGSGFGPQRVCTRGKGWRKPKAVLFNLLYAAPFELCDVRWAHRRGKVVAVTYQGDDARQGEVARRFPIHFAHDVPADYYTDESDRNVRRRIATFERYADLIYALNPDLLAVLPARAQFQPYCSVDVEEWRLPATKVATPLRPRVVHAPSNAQVKGTRYVVDAVRRLREYGVEFDFVLVERMTHVEARRIYETADLAIDQLLAGFYGATAVELMALEVPVLCYLRDEDIRRLPAGMQVDLPLINTTPSDLFAVLKDWLVNRRADLRKRGQISREFVKRWHDPRKVARDTLRDYAAAWEQKANAGRVTHRS